MQAIYFAIRIHTSAERQGRRFSRHAVNTCGATPAALRILCSVCPDAVQSCFAWAPTQYFPVLSVQTFGFHSELVKKSPHEARVLLGVSGKAREFQYLGV